MFNTLSYCFGFASRELNSSKEVESPTFKTEEVEDQWTLVEINDSNSDKENDKGIEYPTPPPSPPIEQSWLITPPPCFDAEVRMPVEELSPMENLLIEHPSIFIKNPLSNLKKKTPDIEDELPSKVIVHHFRYPLSDLKKNTPPVKDELSSKVIVHHQKEKPNTKTLTCSKRKKAVCKSIAVVGKRNPWRREGGFYHRSWDMVKHSSADIRKRRRTIHQPRKHC